MRYIKAACLAFFVFILFVNIYADEIIIDTRGMEERDYFGGSLTDFYGIDIFTQTSSIDSAAIQEYKNNTMNNLTSSLSFSSWVHAPDITTQITEQATQLSLFSNAATHRQNAGTQTNKDKNNILIWIIAAVSLSLISFLGAKVFRYLKRRNDENVYKHNNRI